MFYFMAERLAFGEAGTGHAVRLAPNASNLPNVLHTLGNERGSVFAKLMGHLREIFPTVGNLSVRTRPENGSFEIRIWPTEAMERVELIPSCAEADSDLGFPNGGKSDSMLFFIWRT